MVSKMIRVGVLSLPLAAVSIGHAVYADTSTPATLPTVRATAEADSYKAEESATAKTNTPLRDVPQSISVLTRKTLDDLNVQNIGEAVAGALVSALRLWGESGAPGAEDLRRRTREALAVLEDLPSLL